MEYSFKKYIFLSVVIIGAALFAHYRWLNTPTSYAEVHFLDVGQGDAIYIRTQDGTDILIDGGPDDQVIRRLGEVMPFWDRTLEFVFVSHPDADHITGLANIFAYYQVENVGLVDLSVQSAVHQHFIDQLSEQEVQVHDLRSGDVIALS